MPLLPLPLREGVGAIGRRSATPLGFKGLRRLVWSRHTSAPGGKHDPGRPMSRTRELRSEQQLPGTTYPHAVPPESGDSNPPATDELFGAL